MSEALPWGAAGHFAALERQNVSWLLHATVYFICFSMSNNSVSVHVAECIEFVLEWMDGTHFWCSHVSIATRDCLDNTTLGMPNVQEHIFHHRPHLIEVRPQRGQPISDLWSFRFPPACYLLTGINRQCVTFTMSHVVRVSPSTTHLPFITVKLHPSHICIIHQLWPWHFALHAPP